MDGIFKRRNFTKVNCKSMRVKSIISFFLLIVLLFSCRKDKLVGEYEIFKGEWEWIFSEEIIFDSTLNTYDTNYREGGYYEYNALFLERGNVKFRRNQNTAANFQIFFDELSPKGTGELTDGHFYRIFLNNSKEKDPLTGSINQDTLVVDNMDFPIKNYNEGGTEHSFKHFYVRK